MTGQFFLVFSFKNTSRGTQNTASTSEAFAMVSVNLVSQNTTGVTAVAPSLSWLAEIKLSPHVQLKV